MALARSEIEAFCKAKAAHQMDARQTAALFLICGMDLSSALQSSGAERLEVQRRLKRLIERERLKGVRGHWSYDLNRHIALSQALQRLSRPAQTNADDQKPGVRYAPHCVFSRGR